MAAGTLVKVLIEGKVWKVPVEWASELLKKGWSKTNKVAPNAPKMTRSQLNKVPNKTTAFDEAKHAAEAAKDLQRGAGRQKTGSSERGAGTPAAAEARAGREAVAAQKKAAKAKAARETTAMNKASDRIRAAKKRGVPVRTTPRQVPKTQTGTDIVKHEGEVIRRVPPRTRQIPSGGRTPKTWKSLSEAKAKSTAKDAAGKNPKEWWGKRTPGQKAAILLATGFGAGVLATEEFKKWFGIGGAAVEAQPKPLKPTKLAKNGKSKADKDIYVRAAEAGPDVPEKAKTKKRVKVVPRPKRKPVKAIAAKRKAAAAKVAAKAAEAKAAAKRKEAAKAAAAKAAAKAAAAKRKAAAKNGPKKKTKKAAELSGLEQFWKDVKDLPKYFGTDLLPERVSGTPGMGPGKRKYKWEAPFAGEVEFELDSSDLPMKGGGRLKKGSKKTKARKRAALRGGRAELRGG